MLTAADPYFAQMIEVVSFIDFPQRISVRDPLGTATLQNQSRDIFGHTEARRPIAFSGRPSDKAHSMILTAIPTFEVHDTSQLLPIGKAL